MTKSSRRLLSAVSSRVFTRLDGLVFDVRLALRGLLRDRTFTLAAIAMLALAIGLNVTVFTVMNAMVFRGLPLATRSDRLVYLTAHRPAGPWTVWYADVEAWRSQSHTFEGIAFAAGAGTISLRGDNVRPIDTAMQRVSANTFGLLGVRPMLGRDFIPADEAAGAAPVVILSHSFWERQFNRRADIVGSTVRINGETATIIGVMPEGFVFVYEQNLWMPLTNGPQLQQRGFAGGAFARLRGDATVQQAQAEIATINRRLQAADPATDRSVTPLVLTYSQAHLGSDAPIIYGSLWAAAWFVLLIACANLINLTLVRTIGRWREFSTTIALGASRARMVRQVFVEHLMLASVAGAIGWWITTWSVRMWSVATASRYLALDYTLDARMLAYLVALAVAVAVTCSVVPIARVVQLSGIGALKGDVRGVTQGLLGKRLAAGLVAGQMALALVMLAGAGVLARSLINVVGAETGVRDPEQILVGSMRVPLDKYQIPTARIGYFDRLAGRLKAVPGVEEASLSSAIPVNAAGSLRTLEIEGRPIPPDDNESAQFLTIGSGYFRTVGAVTMSGRDFNDADQIGTLPVAIVNQSLAGRYWPGEDPLGKRFRTTTGNQPGDWLTVVGVASNILQGDPVRQTFKPIAYRPLHQEPMMRSWNSGGCCFSGANFLVRTNMTPDRTAQAIRSEAQNVDPDVVLEDFSTLKARFAFDRDLMDLAHSELGKHATVAPVFAVIALLLAAIGLSAVIANWVSQRTKEIGVRMAIGAAAEDVRRMFLREGMWPVAIGIVVGLAAALAVNRVLQSQLVGVSPYDLATMIGAPAVLMVVALLACQIPARRAMRVDPAVALRHE